MARRLLLIFAGTLGATALAWACVGDETPPSDGGADSGTTEDASVDAPVIVPPDAAGDGAVDDDAGVDAGPRCDTSKPFPAPTEVTELNGLANSSYARLSPDMKTVVFGANPDNTGGGARMYQAMRASADVPFGTPELVPGIDTLDGGTALQANVPTMSPDGKFLYFQSNRSGTVKIYVSSRQSVSDPFGPPAIVEALDDPQNTGQPYLSQDGTTMVFVSRKVAGKVGGIDLWRTTVNASGLPTGFVNITELNTVGDEAAPVISADGLTIYYARLVLEDGGVSAKERIWSASRASPGAIFDNIVPVTSLWLDANVIPSWISPDNCTMYVASDGSGSFKIASSTRPK
jgi:Tol biopolymer transport system component